MKRMSQKRKERKVSDSRNLNGEGCQFFLDAEGYVWRTWPDLPPEHPMYGMWSMARVNPDNGPIPMPVTRLLPEPADSLPSAPESSSVSSSACTSTSAHLVGSSEGGSVLIYRCDQCRALLARTREQAEHDSLTSWGRRDDSDV